MIEVKNLTKSYGEYKAVDNLSFSVKDGEIYGFLGPNGAGKSTTMNIMTGCLSATSGQVLIDGLDIFEDAKKAKKLIGYLPEIPPLYLDLTVNEYLLFVAEAKGVLKETIFSEVERVVLETQIEDVQDRLIKHLSKGYRQRVGIAQALVGNPKVIILDEPTVGLDPKQIIEIRELIKSLGEKHTVIISSHILSEVQMMCETILIISKGKLIACDTSENLTKLFNSTITIEIVTDSDWESIEQLLVGEDYEIEGTDLLNIQIKYEKGNEIDLCKALFYKFSKANVPILKMNSLKASLEDIFIELTEVNEDVSDI